MTPRKKGLGRGLGALGLDNPEEIFVGGAGSEGGKKTVTELSVTRLRPGKYQPRSRMDSESIASLSASIRENGLVSPIVVRPVGDDMYEIIAGERRYRAASMAGIDKVPVIVREVPDRQALSLSLIENIQREDLNPIEEAAGMSRLMNEFGMTQDQVAEALGKSRPAVSNLLRLLKLAPAVQEMLIDGTIDMGHARALLPLGEAEQILFANEAAAKDLSVRDVERAVAAFLNGKSGKKSRKRGFSKGQDIIRIEESLSDNFGTRVNLNADSREKGKIVIRYSSLSQLDEILEKLGYTS